MCSRGHWRPHEDEKLRELVAKYGPHNWNAIALNLQGRSGTDREHLTLFRSTINSNYSIHSVCLILT